MVEFKQVLFHPRPAGGACLILYCYLLQSLALIAATNNSTRCSGPPEVQAEAARRCGSIATVTRLQVHQHACLVLDAFEDVNTPAAKRVVLFPANVAAFPV